MINKVIQVSESEKNTVIKGGYYEAPSEPAKPLVNTSAPWGTASPSPSPEIPEEIGPSGPAENEGE